MHVSVSQDVNQGGPGVQRICVLGVPDFKINRKASSLQHIYLIEKVKYTQSSMKCPSFSINSDNHVQQHMLQNKLISLKSSWLCYFNCDVYHKKKEKDMLHNGNASKSNR